MNHKASPTPNSPLCPPVAPAIAILAPNLFLPPHTLPSSTRKSTPREIGTPTPDSDSPAPLGHCPPRAYVCVCVRTRVCVPGPGCAWAGPVQTAPKPSRNVTPAAGCHAPYLPQACKHTPVGFTFPCALEHALQAACRTHPHPYSIPRTPTLS
jgi:hypothetical protein